MHTAPSGRGQLDDFVAHLDWDSVSRLTLLCWGDEPPTHPPLYNQ